MIYSARVRQAAANAKRSASHVADAAAVQDDALKTLVSAEAELEMLRRQLEALRAGLPVR